MPNQHSTEHRMADREIMVGRLIGALEILVSMAESYCNEDELRAAILNAKPIVEAWTKPTMMLEPK